MVADARGSTWRRWDPHVHLPGTTLNDQFGGVTVAEALDALAAARPAIEAIGATDYASTAGYRVAAEAHRGGAGASIGLIFPNVELRLDVPTAAGPAVNLHLLCAPDHVDELDRLLGLIEFQFRGRRYCATPDNLRALGRAFTGDPGLSDVAALRAGTNQFKVNFQHVRDRIGEDTWAQEHCLVAFAGGQRDGTSGVRVEAGGFEALRQEIESSAHIIFSGNPQQRLYWLGRGADGPEVIQRRYGGLKLCLHGSDAHTAGKLGEPDLERRCWLRGDATFSTLQQACIEPEGRAFIGATTPTPSQSQARLAELVVTSDGWFPEHPIPVNPGLVAIIGARGSGKTAIADLLAAGANSCQPFDNERSFVRRAHGLLDDAVVAVGWTDGGLTTQHLADEPPRDSHAPPLVRYLSQQFVDDLCAVDGISDGLRKEIERVVFNAWPIDQRLGASGFDELLGLRLHGPRERQRAELGAIVDTGREITRLRHLSDSVGTLEKRASNVDEQLSKLDREAKELTRQADPAVAQRFQAVTAALQARQQQAQAEGRHVNALDALAQTVSTAVLSTFPSYLSQLRERNPDVRLADEEWAAFQPRFGEEAGPILALARESAEARRAAIVGRPAETVPRNLDDLDADQLLSQTLATLQAEFDRLNGLVGLDEKRSKRLQELSQLTGQLRSERSKIDAALIEARAAGRRAETLVGERLDRYASYFDALLEEEGILNDLYAPLGAILARHGASVAKLSFSVRRVVDVEMWANTGEQLFDLRIEGAFRGRGSIARAAAAELRAAWESGDGAAAAEAIRAFSDRHSSELRTHALVARADDAAYQSWNADVAAWLYRADHVSLRYTVEYDGIDITRLSPGTRGVVLLLLYLAVDEHETIPLIIDQPEENLDPESVYTELVKLFRQASERRQVIMVTHNANLVVNTDVDQVIVATCGRLEVGRLPRLTYASGGLEDSSIRASVCQILEGGELAFRERARRLRVHWPRQDGPT